MNVWCIIAGVVILKNRASGTEIPRHVESEKQLKGFSKLQIYSFFASKRSKIIFF